MRFVLFTDPHIRGNTPENRKDNFVETQKNKFKEVVEIAKEFEADYFLCGGDLNDAPVPSMSVAGEIMAILLSAKIPIYTVAGNHDFYAANTVTLPRTLLGYTAAINNLTLLDREPVFLTKGDVTVQLTGQAYHGNIDKEDRDPKLDYCVSKSPDCQAAIHIVHGMLMEDASFPGDLTLIKNITSTDADITFSGHNHIGWGIMQKDGKYFINPGGLVRLSNHKAEMTRKVGVVLVEVGQDFINCEFKELESALPGEEVLDRTKIAEMAAMEAKLKTFTQELLKSSDMNRVDVTTIIRQAVSDSSETTSVLDEALRRIAIAEESLAQKGKVA
jgi:exonuclease SbcD